MNYTKQQLGYILYNNRSVDGVVKNFLNFEYDTEKLIDIEKRFEWCKSLYEDLDSMVRVDLSLLNSKAEDLIIVPDQINSLTNFVLEKVGHLSNSELQFLTNRGIYSDIIKKYNILGLSNFTNREDLEVIGATSHPILQGFLQDGISEGGIVIPIFEEGKLVNCAIRRISDVGKLKYTLAVPDIPLCGVELIDLNESEIFITEGFFDFMAVTDQGKKCLSPSSAAWSGIQLYKLLEKKPGSITIFCDNDRVGLKNGLILKKFFNLYKIPCKNLVSTQCKDAAEHFFEKKLTWSEIREINIDRSMIETYQDQSFDFLKYLQKRRF
jgi:hypothetical protein